MMDKYKLKIQVGRKAFTEILTYKKDEKNLSGVLSLECLWYG